MGYSIRKPTGFDRVATVGQTFLDMVREPELCGGMVHVMAVWREHAGERHEEIIQAVDGSASAVARCRAGYILEERLGVETPGSGGGKPTPDAAETDVWIRQGRTRRNIRIPG